MCPLVGLVIGTTGRRRQVAVMSREGLISVADKREAKGFFKMHVGYRQEERLMRGVREAWCSRDAMQTAWNVEKARRIATKIAIRRRGILPQKSATRGEERRSREETNGPRSAGCDEGQVRVESRRLRMKGDNSTKVQVVWEM